MRHSAFKISDKEQNPCVREVRTYFDASSKLEIRSHWTDGTRVNRDKLIYWNSEQFGRQRIGRLRPERSVDGDVSWTWIITVPVVKAGERRGSELAFRSAYFEFRKAFELLADGLKGSDWVRAFSLARRARQRFSIV